MAIVMLFHRRSNVVLMKAVANGANLNEEVFLTDEKSFKNTLRTQQPAFTLLTSEYIDQPDFFASIRQYAPATRIILCLLPDAANPLLVWPLLDNLDIDVLCKLPELNECLTALAEGYFYASSFLETHPAYVRLEPLPGWDSLTTSERSILKLMAEGYNGPQIAQMLFISPKTVENHKYKISQKLNVTGGPGSLVKFSLLNREKLLSLSNEAYQ
ncbi:LuxR C-terminal-related transcriptional regulator [Spirosoma sp. SC4-14]|uniref:response regulator transcription factor n=1 Tax=Spirosoma sp. SC4-14 TaxID=3128900 RepID=UPI0030CE8AA8